MLAYPGLYTLTCVHVSCCTRVVVSVLISETSDIRPIPPRCFLPRKNKHRGMQCKAPSTGNSQLTQISPNRTVTPASSEGAEEYSQRSLASIKTGAEVISPTATWTEVASENATLKEEGRQMPLLRRSSDNGNNQNHKVSPQDRPKPQDSRTPGMITDTQSKKHFKKGAECGKLPENDSNPDLDTRDKVNVYTLSRAKDALEVAGNEGAYARSPRDDLVGGDKPLGKESGGNRIGDSVSEAPKNTAGFEDTKPKGTYTRMAAEITLRSS